MQFLGLQQTIENSNLTCWYQPIYDVKSNAPLGFEALMRNKKHIALNPMEVIQKAQLLGTHNILDRHLIIKAQKSFRSLKDYTLFINVFPSTLLERDFISWWDNHSENLPNVVFELAESERIDNWKLLKSTLRQLRKRNIKVAIDDMGSGYASPQYWLELEPEYIKLDRYYLSGAANDIRKQKIIESCIKMYGGSTQIIAEGIEDVETLELIRNLGACYAQGFLLGMPEPICSIISSLGLKDEKVLC